MKKLSGPKPASENDYGPVQVSFSPNGKYLASWSKLELMVWDTKVYHEIFNHLVQ